MTPLLGHDQTVADWVAQKMGRVAHPPYTAIGWIDRQGTLRAGAIFNNWNGSNVEMTIYGPGAMTRGMVRTAFLYVFDQIKANRLTAYTERSNARMQSILRRLGFEYETTHKKWFGPNRAQDGVAFCLWPHKAQKWMN